MTRCFHLLDAVEDLHRRRLRVFKHQRRAEFREAPNEDDRATREKSWANQRQRDATEASPCTCTEIDRGLFHRGVDVCDRGDEIEIDDGIKAECFEEDDEPESTGAEEVDRLIDCAEVEEQRIHAAASTEQLLHADRAHEWWKHERRENHCAEHALHRKETFRAEVCQWKRDEQRDGGRCRCDEKCVDESAA